MPCTAATSSRLCRGYRFAEESRVTPSLVMAAGLETACNQVLRLDPEILVQLAALDGAVIAIELQGLGLCLCLYLFPGPGGLRVAEDYAGEPTVRIRGTPLALARQWRGSVTPGSASKAIPPPGVPFRLCWRA